MTLIFTTTDPAVWQQAACAPFVFILWGAHLAGMAILEPRRYRAVTPKHGRRS